VRGRGLLGLVVGVFITSRDGGDEHEHEAEETPPPRVSAAATSSSLRRRRGRRPRRHGRRRRHARESRTVGRHTCVATVASVRSGPIDRSSSRRHDADAPAHAAPIRLATTGSWTRLRLFTYTVKTTFYTIKASDKKQKEPYE